MQSHASNVSAVLGSEAKGRIIEILASRHEIAISDLVKGSGMSRNAVNHAVGQLASMIDIVSVGGRRTAKVRPDQATLIQLLANLNNITDEVHPVPGRPMNNDELDSYARHYATLEVAPAVTEDFEDEYLTVPASAYVQGDEVE